MPDDGKFQNVHAPYLTLLEGTTPATPDAGTKRLFVDEADHIPKTVDESDVVEELGGGSSVLVQRVISEVATSATGTTLIPLDDTIPQKTEGDEYMTVSITPTNASNILYIEAVFFAVHSVPAWISAALFQDTTTNALAAITGFSPQAGGGAPLVFRHKMVAGTTSATTFKIRAGGHTAGTTTFNGNAGTRIFGGVIASSVTVSELTP